MNDDGYTAATGAKYLHVSMGHGYFEGKGTSIFCLILYIKKSGREHQIYHLTSCFPGAANSFQCALLLFPYLSYEVATASCSRALLSRSSLLISCSYSIVVLSASRL